VPKVSRGARGPRPARTWTLRGLAVLIGALAPLVVLEVLLRTLPVRDVPDLLPVDERNPVVRFEPGLEFVWSRDWNFSIVNRVRTNNFGFVSHFDYDANAAGPLLAVIGDSYVEAMMVPSPQTCAGRLAAELDGRARVYSFGVSLSPLSQYLAFAEYARDTFRPDALAVVVVDNDYDESLPRYRGGRLLAGMHQFVDGSDGELVLERVGVRAGADSWQSGLARRSALARYLWGNLGLRVRIVRLWRGTSRNRTPALVADSKRVVDAFLDRLPAAAGLGPERIALVVDGLRPQLYSGEDLERAAGSYRRLMRRYVIAGARRRGYETIDLQPMFLAHWREHRERFEFPTDDHWNSLGHGICFAAVARSGLLSRGFPEPEDVRGAGEGRG